MKSFFLFFCVNFLFISKPSVVTANGSGIESCMSSKSNHIESNDYSSQKEICEYQFKDDELVEISKWKDMSIEDMWEDALSCDRAALYMFGMGFLTGSLNLSIDVETADFCFLRSASLGFPPSNKQVLYKSIENQNLFLCMVYWNLLASLGHQEYVVPYHEFRAKIIEKFGSGVFKEVEKIALSKRELINRNIQRLESEKDKKKFFIDMSCNKQLINAEDCNLNEDYWVRFTNFQAEADYEASRFQKVLQAYYENFYSLYHKSRENLREMLDLSENDKDFKNQRATSLKDVTKAIDCTEKFIIALESFQNTPNEDLRKVAREFYLLCQNSKGALEEHQKYFLSPNDYLESNTNVQALEKYYLKVEMHDENLQELFENLDRAKK